MNFKLVINATGRVSFTSRDPLPGEIRRVEFHKGKKLAVIVFKGADGKEESELLPAEVAPEMAPALSRIPTVMVLQLDDQDQFLDGYQVPMIVVNA